MTETNLYIISSLLFTWKLWLTVPTAQVIIDPKLFSKL